jgi:hypothetical protein
MLERLCSHPKPPAFASRIAGRQRAGRPIGPPLPERRPRADVVYPESVIHGMLRVAP